MVDFNETAMRHMCRKCRSKLPAPVSNEREAFCARGCYQSFYLKRCRVCEAAIEQPKRGRPRLICKKSKCYNAWHAGFGFGSYAASQNTNKAQEVPIPCGLASESKPTEPANRPWRQIAGPPLTPSQFHCATLEGTAMDDVRRIEAKNRKLLEDAERAEIEANGNFTESEWREVVSPDGVKCFVTRFRDQVVPKPLRPEHRIPADLSVPPFLDRRAKLDLELAA
jgi:hypothetical protein